MGQEMTEFEVCERARQLRDGSVDFVRVVVRYRGGVIAGDLKRVSPVNAWIQVGDKRLPASQVLEIRES